MRALLFLPLALAAPSLAQDKPDLSALVPAPEAKLVSGTAESVLDGATSRAKISFEAPGTLRFGVEPDARAGVAAREVEAAGAQTLSVEGARARRAAFNGLGQWFRSANEPLLQALGPWLSPTSDLEGAYTLATSRDGEATIIEGRANASGKYLRREQVRSGGAGGQRFYAARSVASWNRPARIRLRVEAGRIVRREDFAGASARALQTWTWRYENGRPTLIEARDARDAVRARWQISYDATPAARPALAAPPEAILEGEAPAGDQAAAAMAQGIVAARNESYGAAVAAFSQAAALKPRAVAVPLALFEVALTTRNDALARTALLKIAALDGEGSLRATIARARLALQRGDATAEALAPLAQVLEGAPNSPARLQAADLMRSGGQREQAAQLLLPLLGDGVPDALAAQAIARLGEWFSPLEQPARDALAAKITGANTSAQVARAVLQSPQNQVAKVDTAKSPALGFVLARHAALAGRDDEAARLWQEAAQDADEALWLRAQLSLAQVAALRKDAAGAAAANRAAWPLLVGEGARESWLRSATLPWIKASQAKALRAALRDSSLRAVGRATSKALDEAEADARLLLALDEAEGNGLDTLRAQATRWKSVPERAAWWQGRLGEVLSSVATDTPLEAGSARKRDGIFDEALRAVDAAIALEPAQPFYREQKLLIASGRVSGQRSVTDAASGVRDRENAQAALSALRASFPSDPDALLSAGLSLLTLKQERAAAPLLQQALAQLDAAAPGDAQDAGSERVARVTARSSLAGALRKIGGGEGAARLYAQLFEAARSPIEQGAFAANWLNALYDAREAAGAAAILSQVARTNWKPSQAQEVLAQVLASVSVRAPWRSAVRQSLEGVLQDPAGAASLGEGATLVAAYLDFSVLNAARRAALPAENATPGTAAPAAPAAQAQQTLDAVVAVWKSDLARLEKLASSSEAGVAGQALSLLAQDALLRGQAEQAATFFERALARVPGDEGLALSLSSTLASKSAPATTPANAAPAPLVAAPEDAARIIKARDALLLRAPLSVALLEQAALMSEQAGRAPEAQALRERARRLALFDDASTPDDYDRLAAPAKA